VLSIRRSGLGVRLGDGQVGGRLIQAALDDVIPCAYQCQLRVILARREGPDQRLQSLRIPVQRQAERMIGEQPGRVSPVARRLSMPDRLDNLAMLAEPCRGPPVQCRHLIRQRPAQLQPEQIREQVVVAEPRAPRVERDHERVRVLQVQQDPFRPRTAGQQIGQLAVDPVQQAGAQQQIPDVAGLAVQHLVEQVLRHSAVRAGEVRDEPVRVGVPGQG